jgi:hypothetical protein
MTVMPKRRQHLVAPLILALGLILCPSSTPALRAQEETPVADGGESKGRPLDGYLATLCLAMLAFFVVGKSARR